MNFLQLLKDSLLTTSNTSNMRTLVTISVLTLLATYVAMVATSITVVFVRGTTFSPLDVPVVLGGTLIGLLGVKGAQAIWGEKDTTQKPPQQ